MNPNTLTVFHCAGKDCAKALGRLTDRSFGKFCKRLAREAGLHCEVETVETECLDRCADAGALCVVAGGQAEWLHRVREPRDRERLLAAFKKLVAEE